MELKTLKDIQKDLRGMYCDTFDEPIDAVNLRQEAIKWIKELNRLTKDYLLGGGGNFWKTQDGKRFTKFLDEGIILITDVGIHIDGINLLTYIFNLTKGDLK